MAMNLQEFLTRIDEFDQKTTWKQSFIKGMRVLENSVLHIEDEFGSNAEELPYSDYAVKSICDRADVSGGAIHRLSGDKFREHLNDYFDVAIKKNSIINVYDGVIYATHSETYAILNIKECVNILINHLNETYPNNELIGYAITPTETIVDFALNSNELNKKYEEALQKKIGKSRKIYPVLRFVTSNTGWSGANIIPILYLNGANTITTEPIILNHKGKANLEKFAENCGKSYSLMLEGVDKINELSRITIDYPANCAANIAKEINLPKKMAMPILLDMEEDYGSMSATAREVYLYLTKLTEVVKDPVRQFKLADQISRALKLDFKKFDRSRAKWFEENMANQRYTPSAQTSLFEEAA